MTAFEPDPTSIREQVLRAAEGGPVTPGDTGPRALMDGVEAADLLQVARDRLAVLIEQELLEVVHVGGQQRFVRAEVLAVRLLGG